MRQLKDEQQQEAFFLGLGGSKGELRRQGHQHEGRICSVGDPVTTRDAMRGRESEGDILCLFPFCPLIFHQSLPLIEPSQIQLTGDLSNAGFTLFPSMSRGKGRNNLNTNRIYYLGFCHDDAIKQTTPTRWLTIIKIDFSCLQICKLAHGVAEGHCLKLCVGFRYVPSASYSGTCSYLGYSLLTANGKVQEQRADTCDVS